MYVDIFYWSDNEERHVISNSVDHATSFGELPVINTRTLSRVRDLFEISWLNTRGHCKAVLQDPEFIKPIVLDWMESKGTEFRPLANRAHNKADQVERKNCVVKDLLERIDADIEQREHDTRIKVSSAEFISKMLNGNSMASSVEMAKGYTLAISGVSSIPVSMEVWRAQKELKAQMLLAHKRIPDLYPND